MATAAIRMARIRSPSMMAARIRVKIGVAYPIAVASGRGIRPRPVKVSPIAVVPNTPRQKWPMGLRTVKPCANSPRAISQIMITGMAKSERKNTISPGGKWSDCALTIDAMTVNRNTALVFRATANTGRCDVKGFAIGANLRFWPGKINVSFRDLSSQAAAGCRSRARILPESGSYG